jgi:hypothetical protein
MTWHFIYEEPLKKREQSISEDNDEGSAPLADSIVEQEEAYQKRLFENDLFVWSLLLLRKDKL